MDITKTLYVTTRKQWRSWLSRHYHKEKEIWLIYFRKSSGKPRIPYDIAVEEALCFGWIDSTVKSINREQFAQRFTPRRAGSTYSPLNLERVRKLLRNKQVISEVAKIVRPLTKTSPNISRALLQKIRSNQQAWQNFATFSKTYQEIRLAYIEAARNRPEVYRRRLEYFIKMTEQKKQFGAFRDSLKRKAKNSNS